MPAGYSKRDIRVDHTKKEGAVKQHLLFLLRKMGLEPTRCNHHKILSLARLPVPTLPHMICKELNNADAGDGT